MQVTNEVLASGCQFNFSVALTPAATAAASAVEQAFTLPSNIPTLKVNDMVAVYGPGSGNNVALGGARVNATFQLVIQFINPTAGSLTHAAGTFFVEVVRAS